MTDGFTCSDCGARVENSEALVAHLIAMHASRIKQYLTSKWVITTCPGQGCGKLHDFDDIEPQTKCSCGNPIGKWAYREAATFIAGS